MQGCEWNAKQRSCAAAFIVHGAFMCLIVLSPLPPVKKMKEERRWFLSRRRSTKRVLWPDSGKLVRSGGGRGCSRMWRHHHSGTDRHNIHTHAEVGVTDLAALEGWVIYHTSTKSAARKTVRFTRCSGPLLVLSETGGHGVLPSSSPLGRSLETETEVYGETVNVQVQVEKTNHVWFTCVTSRT